MSLAVEILGAGTAVPLAVALGCEWLGRRFLKSPQARTCLLPTALAAAFVSGYALLPWTGFLPPPAWRSLPWLALLAALVGSLSVSQDRIRVLRWSLWLTLAMAAAWWLVPTWPDLWPSRTRSIGLLTCYLFLLMLLLDALPDRPTGRLLLGVMTLAAIALSAVLAVFLSIRFGQLAGLAASALAGCFAASFLNPQPASRGLIPGYAVLLGGLAYVGCVEPVPPDPQLPALLLIPAAPLALWVLPAVWRKEEKSGSS